MNAFLVNARNNEILGDLTDLYTFGSDSTCNLVIKNTEVTERHARIEKKDDSFIIRDLRSNLGTFINDVRISEAFLADGDIICIGNEEYIFNQPCEVQKAALLSSKNDEWNTQLSSLVNIAQTDFPVLILGPSGTGKEVISDNIHRNSTRAKGPFVSVNCSALTETLVESELFGHVKGSFTGAVGDRKGAFEAARGGTLFLDEIGDLPYGLQAKMLRALENSEIRPVGSDRIIKTNVRIIAATHQNLLEKIQAQQFRMDLYYRLNVVSVTAPPLKDHMEDFEDLLYTFAKKARVRFSFTAVQRMKKYKWPGNIRELKNTVLRASAMFPKQTIEESQIEKIIDKLSINEFGQVAPASTEAEVSVIKEIEKQMIIKRLSANLGNQRRTAADLGMPKSTLHDRLKIYNIDPKSFSRAAQAESLGL